MRSLTSLDENRAYSPENFSSPVQNDFCNKIGTPRKCPHVCDEVCLRVKRTCQCATRSAKIWAFPLPGLEGAVTPLDELVGQDVDNHLRAVLLDHVDHEWAQLVGLGDHVHVEHEARHVGGSCDRGASPGLLELRKERQHIIGEVALSLIITTSSLARGHSLAFKER
jgi:hypothetical protein